MPDQIQKDKTDSEIISRLVIVLRKKSKKELTRLLENHHVSDLAFYFSLLNFELKKTFLDLTLSTLDPLFFTKLNTDVLEDVVKIIGVKKVAKIFSGLDSWDVTEMVGDLDQEMRDGIINQISTTLKKDITSGLNYPENSIGRIMHKDPITVPAYWTISKTREYVQQKVDHLHEYVNGIIIVDHLHKPQGVLSLSKLLKVPGSKKISEVMQGQNFAFSTSEDSYDVATNFRKYGMSLTAITDDHNRLKGVIYLNDALEIIAETADEDIFHLGGIQESDIFSNFYKTLKKRLPWLFINLATAIMASLVIGVFDSTIEKLVALAVLMPIVASMGGNAGTQTVTIAVRALATNELNFNNVKKIILKETMLGALNGIILGGFCMAIVFFVYNDFELALLFAIAILITLITAGLSGTLIPIFINHLKGDPAISSGIILTTITDIVAFFTFLGFATYFIF